jgi:type VI protein secretion system component VasK
MSKRTKPVAWLAALLLDFWIWGYVRSITEAGHWSVEPIHMTFLLLAAVFFVKLLTTIDAFKEIT